MDRAEVVEAPRGVEDPREVLTGLRIPEFHVPLRVGGVPEVLEWFTLSLFSQTTSVPTDTVVSPKSSMAVIEITSVSPIVVLVLLEEVLLDEELLDDELLDEELEELVLDELVLDVPGGGGVGSRPSARPRNDAIWSRRTDSSGRTRSPPGHNPT